jgi:ATP synthase protein I
MASVGKWETCVIQKPDSRSATSIGLDWGTRITTIGLEFALPAFLGFGLDRWWGTSPWMTLAGALLGLATGMTHVFRLAFKLQESPGSRLREIDHREDADPPGRAGSIG